MVRCVLVKDDVCVCVSVAVPRNVVDVVLLLCGFMFDRRVDDWRMWLGSILKRVVYPCVQLCVVMRVLNMGD